MGNFHLDSQKIMTEKNWKILHKELDRAKSASLALKKDYKYVHDYYLLSLGWMTDLRISEVSALNWEDVSFEDQSLIVKNGKGGKQRTVHFGPRTARLLTEYRDFIDQSSVDRIKRKAVFLNVHRKRYGTSGIGRRMRYWVDKAGLEGKLSYHSLRHGFATRLLNKGVLLHDLKSLLGHSSIAITSVYLHFTEESKERVRKIL